MNIKRPIRINSKRFKASDGQRKALEGTNSTTCFRKIEQKIENIELEKYEVVIGHEL